MTETLANQVGLGERELISIVGAGGKTTLLHTLGCDLATRGNRVILTTTTRMAADQVTEPVCQSLAPQDVAAAYRPGAPLFVMSEVNPDKAVGFDADTVDVLFQESEADFVVVEADGARSLSIKAPAAHEPAIPKRSTTVVVVVGADALGMPLTTVAHRPERIAELTLSSPGDIVSVDLATKLLLHPEGGLKNIPTGARVVMAITKVSFRNRTSAAELSTSLAASPRVDRVVTTSTKPHQPPGESPRC